jgi:hypothetical protein
VQTTYNTLIERMDKRIIDFSSDPVLPEEFVVVKDKRMIYACGDGYDGFVKSDNSMNKTNIEAFAKLGFNVFCCIQKEPGNIEYLTRNPDLNIVLCIMTGIAETDYSILQHLFPNMLELISTDDTRFYPSAKTAFTMLRVGGICERVSSAYIIKGGVFSGTVRVGDLQWGMPNFSIISIEKNRRIVTLKKVGTKFNSSAKYVNNIARSQNAYTAKNALVNKSGANLRAATKKVGGSGSNTYNLGEKIGSNFTIENVVFSIFKDSTRADSVIIKKMTCNTVNPDLVGKAYADMVKVIMLAQHDGPRVLFSKLCSDEKLRPVAYVVTTNAKKGGALCPDSSGWSLGAQVVGEGTVAESGNSLHLVEGVTGAVIKKLTGEADEYDDIVPSDLAEIYTNIYKEIKLSIKAGLAGVGPSILHSQIGSENDFIPVGYMAMERIVGTYITEADFGQYKDELKVLVDKLYSNGIEHGDIHNQNILLGKAGDSKFRAWIIDYGEAEPTDKVIPVSDRNYGVTFVLANGLYKTLQL